MSRLALALAVALAAAAVASAVPVPRRQADPSDVARLRLPMTEEVEIITPESYPGPFKPHQKPQLTPAPRGAARGAAGPRTFCHSHPKRLYLYAWCGVAPESKSTDRLDFVATIDATPWLTRTKRNPQFGKLIDVSNSPYAHTEAHHAGVDKSGKWFGAGGLTAFLQQDKDKNPIADVLLWNLSDPARPRFSHGLKTPHGACTDEFRSTRDGGFAVSQMCGRDGKQGGGWIKIDKDMHTVHEYTGEPLSDRVREGFNPHGIDVDEDANRVFTSDFIQVASTLLPPSGNASEVTPLLQTTMSSWEYSTGKLLHTWDLKDYGFDSNGNMDARRVPNPYNRLSRRGLFWSSNGLGQLFLTNTLDYSKPPQRVYCLDGKCKDLPGTCIQGNPFKGGTRMIVVSFALDQVRLVDISDPYHLKTLYIVQMPKGAGGHVVKYDEDTQIAAVSTYFLDIEGTVLRYSSDQKVSLFYVDLHKDRLHLMGAVDFTDAVKSKGPSNCHGLAFNSYDEY